MALNSVYHGQYFLFTINGLWYPIRLVDLGFIHKQPQESGIAQGGALNLHQALPLPKQLNLNKLSDAGRCKFSGCPTPRKTDF